MMEAVTYFVRHGQTDWNAEGRLQGQADTDLNDLGRAQATRNGHALAELVGDPSKFDFVASPMRRTRETMERLRLAMGLPADGYRIDPRLVEIHFGDWQGQTFEELEAGDPGCYARRESDKWGFVPPGKDAESYAALATRVRPVLDALADNTVCVAHGGILRAAFSILTGVDQGECAVIDIPQDRILRYRDGELEWL